MDGRTRFLWLLWASCLLLVYCEGIAPQTNCPEYVPENEDLSCSCLPPDNVNSPASFSWPGHSDNALLTVSSVKRENNGTRYTCQMVADGRTTSTVYTLKVAYGPSDDNVQVSPVQFVTNWSQSFSLTCLVTDVYPLPSYVWDDITCDNGNKGSTCTFTPHSPTNITEATCIVKRQKIDGFGNKFASKSVQLNFKYPPMESPQIKRHSADRELLRTGDNLTCTVTGGRPTVDEVVFHCNDPRLDGHPGDVNVTSVSSVITVDSAHATGSNMTCFCSATWTPNEDFYHLSSQETYDIEHKALVKNLTLNGTSEAVTVNGEDHVTLLLVCRTFGRPRPTDVNLTKLGDDSFGGAHPAEVINTGRRMSESAVTLSDVQCSDMGTYVCAANNGVGATDRMSIVLNVKCPPRKSFNEVLEMTDQGLSFSLAAYPSPDNFVFFHLGNVTSSRGSEKSSSRFSSLCRQDAVTLSMVNCTITPVDVSKDLLGFYRVTVSNELGSVNITFSIDSEVLPSEDTHTSSVSAAVIAGAAVAAAIVIVIVVVIVVIVVKRRKSPRKTKQERTKGRQGYSNTGFTTTTGTSGTSSDKPTAQVEPQAAFLAGKGISEEPGYSTPVLPANVTANSTKAPSSPDKKVHEMDSLQPYSQVKDATDLKALPNEYATADFSRKSPLLVPTEDELGYSSAGNYINTGSTRSNNLTALDGGGYASVDKDARGATKTPAWLEGPYAVSPCHSPSPGRSGFPSAAPRLYPKVDGANTAEEVSYNLLTLKGEQSPSNPDPTYDHVSNSNI